MSTAVWILRLPSLARLLYITSASVHPFDHRSSGTAVDFVYRRYHYVGVLELAHPPDKRPELAFSSTKSRDPYFLVVVGQNPLRDVHRFTRPGDLLGPWRAVFQNPAVPTMGITQSARLDDDESFLGGWMQAVGMAPTSNYAMWGSAGYPVMPTNPYPYPPGAQVETPAQSHPSAGNSVYNTPLAMPTAHTHAQMVLPQSTSASLDHVAPSHAPIPLPMVELRGPPTAHAGTEAPPQPSAHTPFVAGTLTSSPLSIIPELRGLQALSSTQSRIIALPGSRRSSMRQSSLDSNYPTPPVNINRGVHFAPRVQILVHSPPLSPVIDSPTSSASDLTDASSQADSLSDECDVIPSPTCSSTQDLPSDPGNNYSDDSLLALAVRASDERGPGQDVNDSYDRAASLQQLRHVLHTTSGDEGINYVASPMTLPETAEVRRHGTASPSAQPTTAPPSTPHNQARDPSLPSSPPLSSLPISDIPVLPVFTFQSFSTPPSVTPQPTQLYSHGYQPPPTVPLPESFRCHAVRTEHDVPVWCSRVA
ncbi:hypothetical protein C8Q72DRAFT_794152 [Fomitopsis betulina]|nr:hypothetical protein C8Q72DRAFT_794152 [Fomitopsis betulina]